MNGLIWGIIFLVVGIAWAIYEIKEKLEDSTPVLKLKWLGMAILLIIGGIIILLKYFL